MLSNEVQFLSKHPTKVFLDPVKWIAECEEKLKLLHKLKKDDSQEAEIKRKECSAFFQKIFNELKRTDLITSERVLLSLLAMDILEAQALGVGKTSSDAVMMLDFSDYLITVFNCGPTKRVRNDTKKLLCIDPNYLPAKLPDYLSRPKKDEDRKTFLKRRMAEYLSARKRKLTIGLVPSQLLNEALSINAIKFFGSPCSRKYEQKEKLTDYEETFISQLEEVRVEDDDPDKEYLLGISYLDERERDHYRVFPQSGKLHRMQYDGKNEFVPLKSVPADTSKFSCHEKDGYASFVINARGEIYMGDHIERKFHHSAFMSGGDVLFAGEIKIDKDGTILAITNYSGHYQPGLKSLFHCYEYLRDLGLDMSHCVFHEMDKMKQQRAFKTLQLKLPNIMTLIKEDSPIALKEMTKITNNSFVKYLSTDLESKFATKQPSKMMLKQ